MKRFKNRLNLIVSVLVITGLVVGGASYFKSSAQAAKTESPTVQTAKVRTGDMTITASGAGVVEPLAQVDLAFPSSGRLAELNVKVGEQVTTADVLARLDKNAQAEADFQALFNAQGIANAELARANAQASLDDAIGTYAYLIGSDAWYWERRVEDAEGTLNSLDASATQSQKEETQKLVDDARMRRDYFLNLITDISDADLSSARAKLESAKVNLLDAKTALDIVNTGPSALTSPLVVIGPQTSKLEQTRLAVENTKLTAPFDGTVTTIKIVQGQVVNTSPAMTIATTNDLIAHVYLDETDLDKVTVGNRVIITFDAYPNTPIDGEIILVEPTLQNVDGSPVIAIWVALPTDINLNILPGMNLEAEVIAGEARNTLIVPKQALRELEPGVFAVFVVDENGSLILTPVEVGLMDFANVEILSGLKAGDVVSTGNVETK